MVDSHQRVAGPILMVAGCLTVREQLQPGEVVKSSHIFPPERAIAQILNNEERGTILSC